MHSSRLPRSLAVGFVVGLFVAGIFMAIPSQWLRLPLSGATPQPPAPVWSWRAVAEGEVFRRIDACYNSQAGLRPLLVRLDNQLTYSVFSEAAARTSGDSLVVGPGGWLYQRHYLRHAVTPSPIDPAKGRAAVARIRAVQDRLARRGLAFQLLVAPSKAEVYPAHASPAEFGGRDPARVVTAYELYRPELLAAGVNLLDAAGDFRAWAAAGAPDLFPRSGIHWGYEPALRVLEDLRTRLNRTLRRPLPPVELETTRVGPAFGPDRDLVNLLNLVWNDRYAPITRFPVPRRQTAVPETQLPRLLWVGDSFACGLLELLEKGGLLRTTDFLFYFQGFERWPPRSWPGGDVGKIEWETYLRGFDAVIFVMTERAFDDLGWGFFEAVEAKLPPEPPP